MREGYLFRFLIQKILKLKKEGLEMKKISMLVGLYILCMTLSASNLYAAACSPTRGKVEVSVNGAGVCTNIQTAIDLAAQVATASNPVIVSVLPGTYTVTTPITMRPYVDVVGSGRESTKITANAVLATVLGANNCTIENVWVENNNADAALLPAAILNDNTSMTITKVKATMVNPTGSPEAFGILNKGASSPVISNCMVEVKAVNVRGAIGISARDGSSMTVRNCDITVDTAGASYSMWNVGVLVGYNSSGSVKDSIIKVTGANYNEGVEVYNGSLLSIGNSRIEAIGTSNSSSNDTVYGVVSVNNSEIIMGGTATNRNCAVFSGPKIGGSMIDGNATAPCGATKIVNSWDGTFNPIANYP